MPRPLRFIPEHSLVEITTRTLQGRLLLKPSPELTDIILARRCQSFLGTYKQLLAALAAGKLRRFPAALLAGSVTAYGIGNEGMQQLLTQA